MMFRSATNTLFSCCTRYPQSRCMLHVWLCDPFEENDSMVASKVIRMFSRTFAIPSGQPNLEAKVEMLHGDCGHDTGIACTRRLVLSTTSTLSATHSTPAGQPPSWCMPAPGMSPPLTTEHLEVQSVCGSHPTHRNTPLWPWVLFPPYTMNKESSPHKVMSPTENTSTTLSTPRALGTSTMYFGGQELLHQGSICAILWFLVATNNRSFHGSRPNGDNYSRKRKSHGYLLRNRAWHSTYLNRLRGWGREGGRPPYVAMSWAITRGIPAPSSRRSNCFELESVNTILPFSDSLLACALAMRSVVKKKIWSATGILTLWCVCTIGRIGFTSSSRIAYVGTYSTRMCTTFEHDSLASAAQSAEKIHV